MTWELAAELTVGIVSTAAIVIGITLAVERLGPRIGGALGGLPIVIGPAFFFVLHDHSVAFSANAAAASLDVAQREPGVSDGICRRGSPLAIRGLCGNAGMDRGCLGIVSSATFALTGFAALSVRDDRRSFLGKSFRATLCSGQGQGHAYHADPARRGGRIARRSGHGCLGLAGTGMGRAANRLSHRANRDISNHSPAFGRRNDGGDAACDHVGDFQPGCVHFCSGGPVIAFLAGVVASVLLTICLIYAPPKLIKL